MGATTITEPQGKNVAIPSLRFRSLCCGFWLVPSLRVPEATKARATIRGTQGNQPRQSRSDSLVVDSVPSVGSWLFPSVSSGTTKARTFAIMRATDITEPQGNAVAIPSLRLLVLSPLRVPEATRQRRSDSLVVIPFPLRVPEAARQRATIKGKGVAAMGATTITVSHKAKALRFPRCDSVPSESSRSGKAKGNHQGQGRSGNGSDNHHSKPQGKAVPIPSLWIPFPLLRLLARSLLSDQKAPRQRATIRGTQGIKARTFASMEATTITEPQ